MKKKGALTDVNIQRLLSQGNIICGEPACINPASVDLRTTEEIYRIDAWILPNHGQKISDMMRAVNPVQVSINGVLERGAKYLVRTKERCALPKEVYGYCNAKSSIGRLGVDARVIVDGVNRYDSIPRGYEGDAWIMLSPRHIPIRMDEGSRLVQLRLFNGDTRFTEKLVCRALNSVPGGLIYRKDGTPIRYEDIKSSDFDGSVILGINLEEEISGWECLDNNRPLDIEKRGYNPTDFFRPIYESPEGVFLSKKRFYIFMTKEQVSVPPHLACEMRPIDERAGSFQVHKAGYIDPGYGYGQNGQGRGRPIVLEVTPYDDMLVQNEQAIAKICFEQTCQRSKKHYDHPDRNSHYTDSTPFPRLAKQFDLWK